MKRFWLRITALWKRLRARLFRREVVAGRFEAASGFELSADRRVATLKDPSGRDDAHDADGTAITLRLSWVDAVVPTSSPSRLR